MHTGVPEQGHHHRTCVQPSRENFTKEQLENQTAEQKKDRQANEKVDEACDQAKMQHPALDKEMFDKDKRASEVAKHVLKLSVAVLDRYPRNENTRGNRRKESRPWKIRKSR